MLLEKNKMQSTYIDTGLPADIRKEWGEFSQEGRKYNSFSEKEVSIYKVLKWFTDDKIVIVFFLKKGLM